MHVTILNQENFRQEVLDAQLPVLVDFFASWCGPCQEMAPIIDNLAEEYQGRVKVCKLDVDENPGLREEYSVDLFPTVILFRNGRAVDRALGVQTADSLKSMVKSGAVGRFFSSLFGR